MEANAPDLSDRCTELFCHLLNAHQIWNARILQKTPFGVNDRYSLAECMALNRENHKETLTFLEDGDLARKVDYTTSKGVQYSNSVQEILFHISNHTTHHRGQIIMEVRRNGIAPILSDYIFYKR